MNEFVRGKGRFLVTQYVPTAWRSTPHDAEERGIAAVRLADKLNLTLVGFLRNGGCSIYSHAKRLRGAPE